MGGLSLNIMARLSTVMAMVFEKWRVTMLIIILTLLMSVIILAMRSPGEWLPEKRVREGDEMGIEIPPKLELDLPGAVEDLRPGHALQRRLGDGQESGNERRSGDYRPAEAVLQSLSTASLMRKGMAAEKRDAATRMRMA